jgi:hypothetical protein
MREHKPAMILVALTVGWVLFIYTLPFHAPTVVTSSTPPALAFAFAGR